MGVGPLRHIGGRSIWHLISVLCGLGPAKKESDRNCEKNGDQGYGCCLDRAFVQSVLLAEILAHHHSITRGLAAWELTDETYTVNLPGDDSHVLLTTDHPKCMRTVAWTRQVGQSRVFCLQSGHDTAAFSNPDFRTVVQCGIAWLAER